MNAFGLNHRVAPRANLSEFFDLAVRLGVSSVEIRNELPGVAIADGTPAAEVRDEAGRRGLTIASINALYPFNIWSEDRARQARDLIAYAHDCGAAGIVMCPLNDAAYQARDGERLQAVRQALASLAPMLREAGVVGFVEPLGFPECSLRLKREAVEAIDAVEGADVFRLVHDTFHHAVAGETEMFPRRTGIVHISGVVDRAVGIAAVRDSHRVLVDAQDRLGNLAQIQGLEAGGYEGALFFEPFADSVSDSLDIAAALKDSMQFMRGSERTMR